MISLNKLQKENFLKKIGQTITHIYDAIETLSNINGDKSIDKCTNILWDRIKELESKYASLNS